MLTKDFYFDLPAHLIAQTPSGERGNDKLLHLDRFTGAASHHMMAELPGLIQPGTVMVFNNSRVRRSRVYARPESMTDGKPVEFLFLHTVAREGAPVGENNRTGLSDAEQSDILVPHGSLWKTMVKNAKRQKIGKRFLFPGGVAGVIAENPEDTGTEFRTVRLDRPVDERWFEENGHIPLPPYIKRADTECDAERYQTIYADKTGSAAAPTAGLHFTSPIMEALAERGIETVFVTLHVGLGTFLPVRAENLEEHRMHREFFDISPDAAGKITAAKRENRPVLAVGTTSVRTLESAWDESAGELRAGSRSTDIFIYPGYRFKAVDALFTNFHTPESTLLMLVCAFAGKDRLLAAYAQAVEREYRFFSYGDAMLIW